MDREIKFRGYEKVSKKWIYGYYVKFDNLHFIIPKDLKFESNFLNQDFAVEKDSIEQYTGLKDKNGKEIYGGDIVKIESDKNLEIIWKGGGYYAYSNKKNLFNQPRIIPRITESQCKKYGVIGNKFENPELLK